MKGTLLVFEGIDGSGKATQAALLAEKLKGQGRRVLRISFPDYESDSSAPVKMYLAGDFGTDPGDVNAYAASLFYAVDRFASFRTKWKEFYETGGIVIADRYVTSNMVHQMTKLADPAERRAFLHWLEDTEYEKLELPRPDAVFLLDMPLSVSESLVKARHEAGGSMDIHESHLDYLRKCYDAYQELADMYGWHRIACTEGNAIRTPAAISEDIARQIVINRK